MVKKRCRPRLALAGEKKRYQASVPVVRVYDVGTPPAGRTVGKARRDMIEERETKRIVRPVGAFFILIRPTRPIVEVGTIDKPNRNVTAGETCFEKARTAATKEISKSRNLLEMPRPFRAPAGKPASAPERRSQLHQGGRQRGGNVRQPAGFRERECLGRDKQHTHSQTPWDSFLHCPFTHRSNLRCSRLRAVIWINSAQEMYDALVVTGCPRAESTVLAARHCG